MSNFDDHDQDVKHAAKWPSYRGRFQPPQRKPGWLTYAEFLEWAAANGKSPRPIGRFETNPPLNAFDRSTKFTQTKNTRTLQDGLDSLEAAVKARANAAYKPK
jgi:hypothetical protein